MQRSPIQRFIRNGLIVTVLIGLAGLFPAAASRSWHLPIYEPGYFADQNGVHRVTQPIVGTGPIITVSGNVTWAVIDLGGSSVTRTDPGSVIVVLSGPSSLKRHIVVRNGGVFSGVVPGAEAQFTIDINWQNRVSISDVTTNGQIRVVDSDDVNFHDVLASAFSVVGSSSNHVTGRAENVTSLNAPSIGFELVDGSAYQVDGLIVENPAGDGAVADNCSGCQFDKTTVEDSGGRGVAVKNSDNMLWKHTTVVRPHFAGAWIDGNSRAIVFHKIQASDAMNGSSGFENNGQHVTLKGGSFTGNAGDGILNLGHVLSLQEIQALANGGVGFNDQGTGTFQVSTTNNFD